MILIVGLGNPGEKYKETRHNLGFMVLDQLARKLTPLRKTRWVPKSKYNALILQVSPQLTLVKPQTFMNASGHAVAKLARFYKLKPNQVWVIHDEADLPLGKLKIKAGGGTAGHRGLESIINQWGEDQFIRFRLGIGRATGVTHATQEYVLKGFTSKQRSMVKQMIKKATKAIQLALKKDLERVQNEFN